MSYSTYDRHGNISTSYAHFRARDAPIGGQGLKTWWPDFGPGCQDFSQQRRSHPNEMIFEKVVEPKRWSTEGKGAPPPGALMASDSFRRPLPVTGSEAYKERRLAAHTVTEKQGALNRMEMRQKRVDTWAGEAPIRMSSAYLADQEEKQRRKGLAQSESMPELGAHSTEHASSVSRSVYEKHGFLVGRHQGSIADGKGGGGGPRRHNSLSMRSMLMSREDPLGGSSSSSSSRNSLLKTKKPTGQWRVTPQSSFVFDPRTFLPVPRGGWSQHELSKEEWPELGPVGERAFRAADPLALAAPS